MSSKKYTAFELKLVTKVYNEYKNKILEILKEDFEEYKTLEVDNIRVSDNGTIYVDYKYDGHYCTIPFIEESLNEHFCT